jgi:hypothetical protein
LEGLPEVLQGWNWALYWWRTKRNGDDRVKTIHILFIFLFSLFWRFWGLILV